MESGTQLKESGIPLTIGIMNLSSNSTWNPESKTVLDSLTWQTHTQSLFTYFWGERRLGLDLMNLYITKSQYYEPQYIAKSPCSEIPAQLAPV